MNREDIIRMAREAGFTIGPVTREIYSSPGGFYAELERFFQAAYAASAAAEREACAKVCEELLSMVSTGDEHMDGVLDCLTAIRARGQA